MVAVLILTRVTDLNQWSTLDKYVTMATKKRLSQLYEIQNFANTCFGNVTKVQG